MLLNIGKYVEVDGITNFFYTNVLHNREEVVTEEEQQTDTGGSVTP